MNGGIISKLWLFLDLIRAGNVVFLIFLQWSGLWLTNKLQPNNIINTPIKTQFTDFELTAGWIFPTAIIAMFGYVLNDLLDYHSDVINAKRPSGRLLISRNNLQKVTWILGISIIISLIVAIQLVGYTVHLELMIISVILLALYSLSLKCTPLLGNITIGILCVLALFPTFLNNPLASKLEFEFSLGFLFMIFNFTLIREIVKDLADIKGDRHILCNTLPLRIGVKKTRELTLFLFLINSLILSFWISRFSAAFAVGIVVFSLGPLIFIAAHFARTTDFNRSSTYLKYLMVSSSMLVFIFGLLYS